jgi:uncharacterized protein DUF4394
MERRFVLAASLAVSGCIAMNVSASDLFGVHLQSNDPTPLYSINQSSGTLGSIGATGFANVTDLTSNPITGTLWGVDVNTRQLLVIDRHTGAASAVAALDSDNPIVSIAFDPVTHRLYGNTAVEFGSTIRDTLYQIDAITGHTTPLGNIIGFDAVYALGFDQHGTLFGVSDGTNQLISIDTATGSGTAVATLGLTEAFDIASRPEDDVMFLADSATHALYTLNTASGAVASVGLYGTPTNIVGLAFMSEAPEASTYVTLGIGLGLLVLLRRRLAH